MKLLLGAALLSISCLPLAAACGSKEDNLPAMLGNNSMNPAPPPRGGTPGGGATDAGADGAGCVVIPNGANLINQAFVAETAPVPVGGTIAGGTYFLTGANVYTGVGGNVGVTGVQLQETRIFDTTSGIYEESLIEDVADGGVVSAGASNGAFTTLGTALTLQSACPAGLTQSATYSVINATLHEYQGQNELIFTAQ